MIPAKRPTSSLRTPLAFLLLLMISSFGAAAGTSSNYLFDQVSLPKAAQKAQHAAFIAAYEDSAFPAAHKHISQLLQARDELAQTTAPRQFARLLSNAALANGQMAVQQTNADLILRAMDLLADASALLTGMDPFHEDLAQVMMVSALIQESQGEFEAAIDALRHAQHVVHRHQGVYGKDQLPIVNRLAYTSKQVGDFTGADREYLFELEISDRAFGPNSLKKVPSLISIGNHFALRAAGRPIAPPAVYAGMAPEDMPQLRPVLFRTAFDMYDDAIRILESHHGPDDLRLIKPLKELAYARILQRSGKKYAEEAMQRILAIVEANPGSDIPERALARVELADIYTITGNREAGEHYLAAWQLLEDNPIYTDLQTQLFNSAERLYPLAPPATVLERRPMNAEEGDDLFVDITYSIRPDGRTRDVRILEGNVPNDYRRDLQAWFRLSRYRPRIEEGQLVATPALTSHHVFRVLSADNTTQPLTLTVN